MNRQHRPVNWAMLARHAAGTPDKQEEQELRAWLLEDPGNEAILAWVVSVYEKDRQLDAIEQYSHYKTAPAWEKFRAALHQEMYQEQAPVRTRAIWSSVKIAAAAAVLILLCGTAYFLMSQDGRGQGSQTAAREQNALSWQHTTAATGHVVSITLADGSTIRLAPGSSLDYPSAFGDGNRLVKLEGEAFFEVAKDKAHPFIVQTSHVTTRVLGTSFNIEAYPEEPFSRITLVTGSIAVGKTMVNDPDSAMAILSPNERITITNGDTTFRVSQVREADAKAVADGKLVFDGASMKEVALRIERHYGVRVHLENTAIGDLLFTGTFEHVALDKLSYMIAETTGLSIEQKGNDLFIRNGK